MKKNSFIKNKKAVSAPLDFMVALSILVIGIFLLIYTVNSFSAIYDNPEANLNSKAVEICNLLITSPGYIPDDDSTEWENEEFTEWENEEFPASELLNLGFSKDNKTSGVLSLEKIICFKNNVTMDNYSQIRGILGLDIEKDYWYNFNISVYDINNGNHLLDYGEKYENATFSSSFNRHVIIEGYPNNIKVKVTIFL